MKKDKVIASVLTASMVLSGTPVWAAADFPDMPQNWSTAALTKAVDNGLLAGIDGKICADDYLTRAQMAAIMVRAFGSEGKADLSGYSDVAQGDWYYQALSSAVSMGVLSGYDNQLNPNANITRQEVCSVVSRAFLLDGGSNADLQGFSDNSTVDTWAKGSMAAMVHAGYLHGDNGKLKPKAYITRAEFAAIMGNLANNYIKSAGTVTSVEKGNVVISKAGVTLSGVTVQGDLILADGIQLGDVNLDHVTVTGRVIVRGGGAINLSGDTNLGAVKVANKNGKTIIAVAEGAKVNSIISSTALDVTGKGTVNTVTVTAGNANVSTPNTTVKNNGGTVTAAGKNVPVNETGVINSTGSSATVTGTSNTPAIGGGSSSGGSSGGSSSGGSSTQGVHKVSSWQELKQASLDAKAGDTIQLTADITDAGSDTTVVDGVSSATLNLAKKNLTFDGNGKTIRAAQGKSFCFDIDGAKGGNTGITVKNITVDGASFKSKLGGAFFVEDGTTVVFDNVTVKNSKAASGSAFTGGGAIFINDHGNPSDVTVKNSTFVNNAVPAKDGEGYTGRGGAIYVNNFRSSTAIKLNIENCTFTGNKAAYGGAIAADGIVDLTVKNCTFDENIGAVGADDIYIFDGVSAGKKNMSIHSHVTAVLTGNTYSNAEESNEDQQAMNVLFGRYYNTTDAQKGNAPEGVKDILFADMERTIPMTGFDGAVNVAGVNYVFSKTAAAGIVNGNAVTTTQIGDTGIYYAPAKEALTGTLYGTANVPYAEFYYGEFNETADSETLNLQTDKAENLRAEGYDAVSCATANKSARYTQTYNDINAESTDEIKGHIYGVKTPVAVSADLYVQGTILNVANRTADNQLLDIIASMKTVSEEEPATYKTLYGDGTLSALQAAKETQTLTAPTGAALSSTTAWGSYQISYEGMSDIYTVDQKDSDGQVTTPANVLGVILEDEDGKQYGLRHSENTWLQAGEIAFAVQEMTEPHGNVISGERFAGLEGKTIKKITYLLNNAQNVVMDVDLYCPKVLTAEQKNISAAVLNNFVDGADAKIQLDFSALPYKDVIVESVVKGARHGKPLAADAYEYDANTKILTIKNNNADTYVLTFGDKDKTAGFASVAVRVTLTSDIVDAQASIDVSGETPTLQVGRDVDLADFMAKMTNIRATSDSAIVFENATANDVFDAAGNIIHKDLLTAGVKYTLDIQASGYKDSQLVYVIPEAEVPPNELEGQATVETVGNNIVSGTYEAKVKVTVDGNGNILSVVDNGTEPGNNATFWQNATGIFGKLVGKTAADVDSVDVVSGATVSSNAIKEAVKQALNN